MNPTTLMCCDEALARSTHPSALPSTGHLLPELITELSKVQKRIPYREARVLELGGGDGRAAFAMERQGWAVTTCTERQLLSGAARSDLVERLGTFPVVTSLDVVEHVCCPRQYAATLFSVLQPQGTAIISTPYHGYWKNLALALSGRMDARFTALREQGHTWFWSIGTLSRLLEEAGFQDIRFLRVGPLPAFAKSMIAVTRKP